MKRLLSLLLALVCAPALAQTYPPVDPGGCTHDYDSGQTAQAYCSDAGHARSMIGAAAADAGRMTKFCQALSYPTYVSSGSATLAGGGTNYQASIQCKTAANNPVSAYIKAYFNASCTVRNPYLGAPALKAGLSDTHCIAGCEYKITSEHSIKNVTVTAPGQATATAGAMHLGVWEYDGNTCAVTPEKPREEEKPDTECLPAASGQTFCIRQDGKECYTASTGRTICWAQGERGEKPDGPTLGKNQNGKQPSIPDTIPPLNQNWEQGPSTNVETTRPGTGPTTYNVNTNYTTSGRGPAGNNNSGTQTDGSGRPIGTSGTGGQDGDGDDTASGGGNCETPPVTSGDPILGMVATQTWATRCAVDAGNAAKVTGNIGDCTAPFTVEGDNANAVKLRAMRAQLCPNVGEPGDPGAEETEADRRGLQEVEIDGSELDQAGWLGGGSCPALASGGGGQMSRGFAAFLASPPPIWCQYISWIRAVFIALATITAIYILKAD